MRVPAFPFAWIVLGLTGLAGPAAARPGDDVIKDKHLLPYNNELRAEIRKVNARKMPVENLVTLFRNRAAAESDKRIKAIRTYVYGRILMDQLKQDKAALPEFQKALKLHPSFPAVLARLGQIADQAKDHKRGIDYLNRALDLDPDYTKALNYLAMIRFRRKEFDRAIRLYKQSYDIDSNVSACMGLSQINVVKFRDSFAEKRRKKYAHAAVLWAEFCRDEAPENGGAHLFHAKILVDVGQEKKALKALDGIVASDLPNNVKASALYSIFQIHVQRARLKPATAALKRMLKYEDVIKGKARAGYEQTIEDLEQNGGRVFLIWHVERQLKILRNPGHDAKSRRDALRALLSIYVSPEVRKIKEFDALRKEIFKTTIRTLKNAQPDVTKTVFLFFQSVQRDPVLLRILVHFIYPNDDKRRTPEVRRAAVRTIASVGGLAALPTLYYCLLDEPGEVLREVESNLARLCQISSRVGGGQTPLTREQARFARVEWRLYFVGEDGAAKMAEAIRELRKLVNLDAGFNRSQATKPMADHIAHAILLEGDMPYATWIEGYRFLRDYISKDFRPVKDRNKEVTEKDRKPITTRIEEFFGGKGADLPEVENPK